MLTSGELQQLLQQRGILDLKDVPEAPLDSLLSSVDEQGKLYGVPGGSGGALLRCCSDAASWTLFCTGCCTSVLHVADVVADSNHSPLSCSSVLPAVCRHRRHPAAPRMFSGPLFYPWAHFSAHTGSAVLLCLPLPATQMGSSCQPSVGLCTHNHAALASTVLQPAGCTAVVSPSAINRGPKSLTTGSTFAGHTGSPAAVQEAAWQLTRCVWCPPPASDPKQSFLPCRGLPGVHIPHSSSPAVRPRPATWSPRHEAAAQRRLPGGQPGG